MNERFRRLCNNEWGRIAVSAIITSVFFFIIYWKSHVVFFINDDENIMYTLAGYYTNGIPGDHSFVNYLLGLVIGTLYSLIPSIPWYGVFHVVVLFSSIIIIGKTLIQEAAQRNVEPIFAVCIFCGITLLCFTYPVTLMQFTVTSAMAGIAAIALLLTGGKGNCILSVVFMLLCYLHRKNTGNVILCFYALVAVYHLAKELMQCKTLGMRVRSALSCKQLIALVMALCCILCAVFISEGVVRTTPEWDDFYEFDEARFKVTDYAHDSYGDNSEMYQEMGWSASLYRLSCAGYLFFMDERVNAESFDTISATGYKVMQRSISECIANFTTLITNESMAKICAGMILLFLVLILLASLKKLRKTYMDLLLAVCAVGGAAIMILYLCWKGRFILRAFQTIAYPTIAILSITLIRVIGTVKTKRLRKSAVAFVTIVLLVLGVVTLNMGYGLMCESRQMAQDRIEKSNRTHLAEEYAIAHPDNMYIYDTSLTFRYSPFVTYVDAFPSNLSYWGGMGWNSPTLLEQASQNGIDKMCSDIFFRDDVYYISYSGYTTSGGERIIDLFMNYMTETYGNVTYELVDTITPEIGVYKIIKLS